MGSPSGSHADDTQDICVICLAAVTERAIAVPCNHYTFDFVCLVSWLQERSTCPLCKVEVTVVQYDWRSPQDFKSYEVRQSHPPRGATADLRNFSSSIFTSNDSARRPRRLRRAYSPPVEDPALLRRRQVYRKRLYCFHVGSNQLSGYRDLTPQLFASSADLQSKARTWIRRELRVFSFLHGDAREAHSEAPMTSSNAEFLLSYIVSILKMVDIKASNGHAQNLLTEFLGRENSKLFLHELNAWLRSPFSKVDEWDRTVQYEEELVD